MQSIKVISLSFKNADLATRGKMQFSEAEIRAFLATFKTHADVQSLVLLSTCNRTELYFESDKIRCDDMITALLAFKQIWIEGHFIHIIEDSAEACKYILEVSVGLHSMLLGDKQIFQQVKKAYQISQAAGLISGIFERLFQQVFKTHKRIQNETLFLKGSQSTSYLAVEQAKKRVGLQAKVLLIGAGDIAQDVAKYLDTLGFTNVSISNRTPNRAYRLCGQHPSFSYLPFDEIRQSFATFDVVISSVGVGNLITNEWITEELKPQLIIDLGVPASVEVTQTQVIHLDELAATVTLHKNQSLSAIKAVKDIIQEDFEAYMRWYESLPINVFLSALKNHYRQTLLEKLTQHNQIVTEPILESVVNALMKMPAVNLKSMELRESLQSVAHLQHVYHF